MTVYDLVIIGAGPAGITASIYAARKKMNFIVITKDIGGQTLWTKDIENYTGFQLITGMELIKKFREHMEQFGVTVKENERAVSVTAEDGVIAVKTDKAEYRSRTAIIASGRVHKKLGVEGEDVYKGKGVAYCATCDAPLFRGLDVAVVGGGNSAMDAALQLTKIANKVYILNTGPDFTADPLMVDKVLASDKVKVYSEASIKRIYGDKFVSGITIERAGRQEELSVRGVFVGIGSVAATDFVPGAAKNREGEIQINCSCETSVPGIYAAGDSTSIPAKQIIISCGEGAKASIAAFHYISIHK